MSGRLPAELSVGYEAIDGQHRLLLRDLDALRATLGGADVEATKAALVAVQDGFAGHFHAEEALMAENAYPDRGKHKVAHDMFLQDVAQLARELETIGLSPLARSWIDVRLPEWTRFHIQVNDAPLGRFLAASPIRTRATAAKKDGPVAS